MGKKNISQKIDPIEKSIQLLVEGHDEVVFIEAMLEEMGIFQNIQVQDFGGRDRLKTFFEVMIAKPELWGKVESIGVLMDADESFASAFQRVQTVFMNSQRLGRSYDESNGRITFNDFSVKVSVFISPDHQGSGMLETLLLRSASDKAAVKCMEHYFECLNQNGANEYPANEEKAKLQVYMASRKTFPNQIERSIQKKIWDFNSPHFNDIKVFLNSLKKS